MSPFFLNGKQLGECGEAIFGHLIDIFTEVENAGRREECWAPNKNLTEKLIKVWNGGRERGRDIYPHWLAVGEGLTRCNLD